MASPDYIKWPTGGIWFNRDHPLAQGCIGYWLANPAWWGGNQLRDLSAFARHGTTMNNFTLPGDWTARGLSFNGTNSNISGMAVRTSYTYFTLIAVIAPGQGYDADDYDGLFRAEPLGGHYVSWVRRADNVDPDYDNCLSLAWRAGIDTSYCNAVKPTDWAIGNICHYAAIAKGTAVNSQHWQNGNPMVIQFAVDNDAIPAWSSFVIGVSTNAFLGKIALFSLYDRALTGPEIQAHAADPFVLARRPTRAFSFAGAVDNQIPTLRKSRRKALLIG